MVKNFFFNKESEKEKVGIGVRRVILAHSAEIMVCEVWFDEGADSGELHKHFHEQATYVDSGEFEYTVGDDTAVMRAGDSVYIEPEALHGCKCLKEGVLIDIFTPQREEFLK